MHWVPMSRGDMGPAFTIPGIDLGVGQCRFYPALKSVAHSAIPRSPRDLGHPVHSRLRVITCPQGSSVTARVIKGATTLVAPFFAALSRRVGQRAVRDRLYEDVSVEKQISPLPLVDHPNQQAGRGPQALRNDKQKKRVSLRSIPHPSFSTKDGVTREVPLFSSVP